MTVKCKHCRNFKDGFCTAKSSGGKNPYVRPNTNRACSKFFPDPIALAEEADKVYNKSKIPIYSPTWRNYSSKKELLELGEYDGPRYVRINPNV